MKKIALLAVVMTFFAAACSNSSNEDSTGSSLDVDDLMSADDLHALMVEAGLECVDPIPLEEPELVVDELRASPTHTVRCGRDVGGMVFDTVDDREALVNGMRAMACEYQTSLSAIVQSNWMLADDSGQGVAILEDIADEHGLSVTLIEC